ncbi:hypothetical protein J2X45_003362 [Caulobacter sp. BE264]|uniref:hypothetical protein n=1 Tax=Caulobacter sp. BE264 TaxID=2817724 RepID=UPI0028615EF8|nr:hypothetical protein [Caulobacter sp. BE264]MDR7232256.1 hypothetical protein [Caulobacter sp. BE264]
MANEITKDPTIQRCLDLGVTPLELDALRRCVERGSTRTNDGGMTDCLLSGLCSKPADGPLVAWRVNPNSWIDGYISLYEPTEAGRRVVAAAADLVFPEAPAHG